MILAVDLSILSSLNFIFYFILAMAILIGFARGLKKTLFNFVMMAIFYVVFFLTINQAVNFLWTLEMPWLGGILGNVDPALAGFTTFEGSLGSFIEMGLGGTITLDASSVEVIALATGIMQFVIKIVWTILYFTVILLVYKILCFIISAIFLKSPKEAGKNRGFGALFGVLNGVMAIFVTMIVMGGFMSTAESALTLIENTPETTPLSFDGRFDDFSGNGSIIPLADTSDLDSYVTDLQGMIDGFNNNLFVKLGSSITTPSTLNSEIEVPLHIDLFDQVLSFEYDENIIGIRYELAVFSNAAAVLLESDFMTTNDITDITGDEIRSVFSSLSESNLIVSLLPVAIEIAADSSEQDLPVTHDELYAIDFESELTSLGSIAGALFDIINDAGFIDGDGSLDEIALEANDARELFADIADSEIIMLLTKSLLFPMLDESLNGYFSLPLGQIITDLEAEYIALGEIVAAIISANISFSDLADGDVSNLLGAISDIDLTILLESELVTEALINIFSGNTDIEGLDFLIIPDDIEWRDTYDIDGNLIETGELHDILDALNGLTDAASDLDLENLDINTLLELDDEAITDFFNSYVIRATVSDLISNMEFGDTALVFPDSVYDDSGYFTETELVNVVKAIKLILTDGGVDFDIMKVLQLTDTEKDILLASDILHATIGKLIYDLGTSTLIVPDEAIEAILVDGINETVVTRLEIKAILNSLSILGITDFDTLSFDASIINNLENDDQDDLDDAKIQILLNSTIIHATISDVILDLDVSNGGVLIVPSLSPLGVNVTYTTGTVEYISQTEIGNMLKALYTLDITDFNSIDLEDTDLLLNNLSDLIVSNIIHATVSDIILGLEPIVLVPEVDVLGNPVKVVQGTTTYIDQTEIEMMLDALELLGITDPTAFASTFDLSAINTDADQTKLLDSAIMHATISKTLLDLGDAVLIVPMTEEDGLTAIRLETGPVGSKTEFIVKAEIKALINAFNVMGFTDLETFGAEIDPALFLANADDILLSSSLQATLSNQIITSASGTLVVPEEDAAENLIVVVRGTTTYILKSELEHLIDALNLLGVGDPTSFDSTFDLSLISTDPDQTTLLDSAIMHATISKTLFDLGSAVLIVPMTEEDGLEAIRLETGSVGNETEYIVKTEIKALINAFTAMGFTNLETFGAEMDTALLLANSTEILASSSLQATLSNQILTSVSGNLIVPDEDEIPNDIRILLSDVTYIRNSELQNFIDAINLLGITDLDAFSINPSDIFVIDLNEFFDSYIMQATVSKYILDEAGDETAAVGTTQILVPTDKREDILVATVAAEQIEKTELINIINALDVLGMNNFDDPVDSTSINTLSEAEITTVLQSASFHVTIDNMLRSNVSVSAKIPALAETNLYGVNPLTTQTALTNFILASNAFGGASFTSASFDVASIAALTPAERDIVLNSMIVRNILTDELEIMMLADDPIETYWPANSDYELSNPLLFLTEAGINNVLTYYGLI